MNGFEPTKYELETVATGRRFEDAGWSLADPQCQEPSLVRAVYEKKQIAFGPEERGIYQFADWMPVRRMLKGSAPNVTYRSEKLAARLKLPNLHIAFSGWWPEIGAAMSTCSFKETEAYSVCARIPDGEKRVLVVASAGNTARAFAKVCSENNIPLLLSVPEENIDALWFERPLNECVKLMCSPRGTDYFDAIALGDAACTSPMFFAEGGAKNIARRDGMATTVLSAAKVLQRTPEAYFQAIGSGTGTIAAWEANLRLIDDGRFGSHKMKLFPSQNVPFLPMYDAWKAGSRALLPMDDEKARVLALEIDAKVLSNRRPPYSLRGGVYDAMLDAGGDIECATNADIAAMQHLFLDTEGIDIHPAAAVALQGMINAFEAGKLPRDTVALLNVTGGGQARFQREHKCNYLKPSLIGNASDPDIVEKIEKIFR
ncbi:MAG: cysteate synthase [Bacteroidales bacterium]|nr:cysteate synthase [Bacteroidales bacterium]